MVNWDNYNESLVRRGEVILDFDVLLIDSWDNEFDNMNNGKEGGGGTSYKYPNSFVQLLDWLYERAYFHLPSYRQTD